MCAKIRAVCEVVYDIEDVLNDLRNDYPDDKWDEDDARLMIYNWLKDDFSNIHMEYRIEEINGQEDRKSIQGNT